MDDLRQCEETPPRRRRRSSSVRSARVPASSGGRRHELRHPEQVVRRGDEVGPEAGAGEAAVATLAPAPDRLAPAEDLFDPLPRALAQRVARMPRGAAIE